MAGFTLTLIMVARPAVTAICNQAAANADIDGGAPFNIPLRLAGDGTNTVVADWCCWTMKPATAAAIKTWLTNHGATAAETTVYTASSPPKANRIALYNAANWTPDRVLTDLGLDRLSTPPLPT